MLISVRMIFFLKGLFLMKKVVAVLLALVLALTCVVSASALGDILSNGSGQLTPIFADFDPAEITNMLSGMDFSGILNDLGMGDLGSLLGGFDISSLLGSLNLEDLLGGLLPGGSDDPTEAPDTTTTAPSTTAPTTAAPTTTAPTTAPATTAPNTNIPKTGDAGIGIAFGLAMAAGAAFVFTRRKVTAE